MDTYPVLERLPIGDLIEYYHLKETNVVFNLSVFIRYVDHLPIKRYEIHKIGDWERVSQTKFEFYGYESANQALTIFFQGGIKNDQNQFAIHRFADQNVILFCQKEALEKAALDLQNPKEQSNG